MRTLLALTVVLFGLPLAALQANEGRPNLERVRDLSHRHHHHHHHHHWRHGHHRHHHHHHYY